MITQAQAKQNNIKIIDRSEVLDEYKNTLVEKLKALLPGVINSDNQLDVKALNDVIDLANTTSNNQGYELTFAGKGIAKALADSASDVELKAETAQSKNFDNTDNVVIRGDNLDVLKILQANYYNKIKMIYIDPPYNTKNDNFIYKDNFKKTDAQLIEEFSLSENTSDFLHNVYGTRSHSGWLSFIYPRLKLARELLTDDGVIFISIDDNEQANLRIICDEIFGEDNFVANFKWNKTSTPPSLSDKVRTKYEYVLCYEKRSTGKKFNAGLTDGNDEPLLNSGNALGKRIIPKDKIEFRFNGIFEPKKYHNIKLLSKLSIKNGKSNIDVEFEGRSKWTQKFINNEIEQGTTFVVKTTKFSFRFLRKEKSIKKPSDDICLDDLSSDVISKTENDVETNEKGSAELIHLFGKSIFENPKPSSLIKYVINFNCLDGDIILDFFAGTGTTADAVMQLNAKDGGARKFILVQIDEPIDKTKSAEAHKFCTDNNFQPVISSITIERLNRAGEKIKAESLQKHDSQKQEPLFKDKKCPDIGYKVFNTTPKPQVTQQDSSNENLILIENPRANTLDTLANMLCATCKTLDSKIECLIEDKLYQANDEIYLLANVSHDELEKYTNLKINLDGWANIDLQQYLNLGVGQRENLTVVY